MSDKNNINAIIAYLTIFGAIVAIIFNAEKNNAFARKHIRQAFGLHLCFFLIGYFVSMFNSWPATLGFWIFFFTLWLYGFIGAISKKEHLVPFLGNYFQQWFTFIK